HPYYHGRVSYVRCGPNITKKNPDGSDTLFKFAPGPNYYDPLFGIKTDTIVVRGEQGIFLHLYGPVMYMIAATSAGVDMDSVAFDKPPLPTSMGVSRVKETAAPAAEMTVYPNPFNPEASILLKGRFTGGVRIFSVNGQQTALLFPCRAGKDFSEYRWNASRLQSGVYIPQAREKNPSVRKKLILLK
ncbi:MAG: T9SS type A sorting domain-containing protein, partial [Syntrophaceae bacterium]